MSAAPAGGGGWGRVVRWCVALLIAAGVASAQTGGTPAPGWYFMISRTSVAGAAPNVSNGYAKFETDGTGLRIAQVLIPPFNSITYDPVAQSLGTGTTYSPTAATLGQPGATGLWGNLALNPGTVFRPTTLGGVYTFSGTLSWITNGTNAIPSVPLTKPYLTAAVDRWDGYVDLTGMGLGVLFQYVAADARLVATFRGASGNTWLIEFYRTNITPPAGLPAIEAGGGGGGGDGGGGSTSVAPTISMQPVSQQIYAGGSHVLSVGAGGTPAPTYQWTKDSGVIAGATNSSYAIPLVTSGAAGRYAVIVRNDAGSVTSDAATLSVGVIPLVAAGDYNSLFVTTDGTLWDIGPRSSVGTGSAGMQNPRSPVAVTSGVVGLSSSTNHVAFIKTDASLWMFGQNNRGQLADGTTVGRALPLRSFTDVLAAVAAGANTAWLRSDRGLMISGANNVGQFGNGTTVDGTAPVRVAGGVATFAISGIHTLWVTESGILMGTGGNEDGQLGDGTWINRSSAIEIARDVVAVAAGTTHTVFLKRDRSVWTMGWNRDGQLGDGTTAEFRNVPRQVGTDVAQIAAGHRQTMWIKTDGTLWGMGNNDFGQLGDGGVGPAAARRTPVRVDSDVARVSPGAWHTLYVKKDGSIWGMGWNETSQLADGTTINRSRPVRTSALPAAGPVAVAPAITTQPVDRTAASGGNASFVVVATGAPAPTYQWIKDGVALAGATAATLTLSNVRTADAGSYSVVVTNAAGTVTSAAAVLTVTVPTAPSVIVPPVPQFANAGGTATFAVIATGTAPLAYQWRRNGQSLAGATAATLAISPVLATDAGNYSVTVNNAAGSTSGGEATLTVATGATTHTTATAFSATANPNGVWRAGYRTAAVSTALTVYTRPGTYAGGIVGWNTGNGEPNFTKHLGTVTQFGLAPGQIALHPGPGGEFSVLRFTAPAAGTATVAARFYPGDSGATDVLVVAGRAGGATQLFAGVNAGTYAGTVTLAVGDTVDLVVGPRDGYGGDTTPVEATIELGTASAPVILTQPAGRTAAAGGTTYFYVVASGSPTPTYQWRKDGVALAGATGSLLVRSNVSAADVGSYTVVVTNSAGTATSAPAALALEAPATGGRLINLSILTALTPEHPSFKLGTVLGGRGTTGTKPLVVRAVGPSLSLFGLATGLSDPRLEIVAGSAGGGAVVASNDNWGGSQAMLTAMAEVGAFVLARADSRDAVVLPAFAAGDYVVEIAGVSGTTGSVLAEIYDATPTGTFGATTPRLVNVSVLKHLGSGVTMGFVVGGGGPRTVLVRAVGPGLAAFGVGGLVADPRLELFNGAAASVATNDNWGGTPALTAAFSAVGAFALEAASRDAAIVASLPPGSYTVQVGGVGGATGVALVEVYEVP